MKTKLLSYVFLGLLFVTSCSSDDGDSGSSGGSIIGKWYMDTNTVGDLTLDYLHQDGCEKDYIEFLEDLTYNSVIYDESCNVSSFSSDSATYSIDGNVIDFSNDVETETVTYSISGNKLTLTFKVDNEGDGVVDATIVRTYVK